MHTFWQLFDELDDRFKSKRDLERAEKMSAYLRNQFDTYGLSSPIRKKLTNPLFKDFKAMNFIDQQLFVEHCWDSEYREFQYTAQEYLAKTINQFPAESIELIEFMIVNKSWWDTVDSIASNIVFKFFLKHKNLERTYPDLWIENENIWLKRTAIIYQLKAREKTDIDRVFKYILKVSGTNEFFINKACGWALRQYSKFNPTMIKIFIESNDLHPLTVREGSKYI